MSEHHPHVPQKRIEGLHTPGSGCGSSVRDHLRFGKRIPGSPGWTDCQHVDPLAVISVALLRRCRPLLGRSSILDHNIAQTTGSRRRLCDRRHFTIPALFLWGFDPGIAQIGSLALLGGLLGTAFMIPLRRFLIVRNMALSLSGRNRQRGSPDRCGSGRTRARNVFIGLGVGAVYKGWSTFCTSGPTRF